MKSPLSRIEVMKFVGEKLDSLIEEFLNPIETNWQPTDFLPDSTKENFLTEIKENGTIEKVKYVLIAEAPGDIEAILQTPANSSTIPITNVLGQTIQMKLLGKLLFNINKQTYSLDVVEEETALFVIFGDLTNKKETYGAGRFMYIPAPDSSGRTVIDFNKAFNPPCVFTPYATCPLPPKQNILPIPITAGEKNYITH
jgi:hypothetical protein